MNIFKASKKFAEQKFRLDLGISFLVLINLSLLVITASDKLSSFTGISSKIIILICVPAVIFGTWLFGYILDKAGFQHGVNENMNDRNPQIQEILKTLDEIKTEMKR